MVQFNIKGVIFLEERIFELEKEVEELKNRIKMLEMKIGKKHNKNSIDVSNKIILDIIFESIEHGTLLEDYIYCYVDKKVMHDIAKKYEIKKRILNYNILNNINCIVGVSKSNAYFQKRINNKNTWLYRINKNILNKERDECLEE